MKTVLQNVSKICNFPLNFVKSVRKCEKLKKEKMIVRHWVGLVSLCVLARVTSRVEINKISKVILPQIDFPASENGNFHVFGGKK